MIFDEKTHGEELSNVWRELMMNKKMYKIYFYHPYNPLNSLQSSENEIEILDWLSEKGYVDKKPLTMYLVEICSEYSLLKPSLFPFGLFTLNGKYNRHWEQRTLDEDEYENLVNTSRHIKKEIDDKKWRHIESLNISVADSFNNIRYEVKDIFFDAIYVDWDNNEKKIKIALVEPFFKRDSKVDTKNWRRIKELPTDDFFESSENVRKEVENLDWKKKIKGIITFEGRCYFLENSSKINQNSDIIDVLVDLDLSDIIKAIKEYDDNRSEKFVHMLGNDISRLRDECNCTSRRNNKYDMFKTTDTTTLYIMNLVKILCTNESEVLEFACEMDQIFRKSYNTGQNLISISQDEILEVTNELTIKKDNYKLCKNVAKLDEYIGKIYKRFTKTTTPNSKKEWFLVQVGIMIGIRSFLDEKFKIISNEI